MPFYPAQNLQGWRPPGFPGRDESLWPSYFRASDERASAEFISISPAIIKWEIYFPWFVDLLSVAEVRAVRVQGYGFAPMGEACANERYAQLSISGASEVMVDDSESPCDGELIRSHTASSFVSSYAWEFTDTGMGPELSGGGQMTYLAQSATPSGNTCIIGMPSTTDYPQAENPTGYFPAGGAFESKPSGWEWRFSDADEESVITGSYANEVTRNTLEGIVSEWMSKSDSFRSLTSNSGVVYRTESDDGVRASVAGGHARIYAPPDIPSGYAAKVDIVFRRCFPVVSYNRGSTTTTYSDRIDEIVDKESGLVYPLLAAIPRGMLMAVAAEAGSVYPLLGNGYEGDPRDQRVAAAIRLVGRNKDEIYRAQVEWVIYRNGSIHTSRIDPLTTAVDGMVSASPWSYWDEDGGPGITSVMSVPVLDDSGRPICDKMVDGSWRSVWTLEPPDDSDMDEESWREAHFGALRAMGRCTENDLMETSEVWLESKRIIAQRVGWSKFDDDGISMGYRRITRNINLSTEGRSPLPDECGMTANGELAFSHVAQMDAAGRVTYSGQNLDSVTAMSMGQQFSPFATPREARHPWYQGAGIYGLWPDNADFSAEPDAGPVNSDNRDFPGLVTGDGPAAPLGEEVGRSEVVLPLSDFGVYKVSDWFAVPEPPVGCYVSIEYRRYVLV